VKQKDLLKDGSKDGKYEGNKWGGKFLRAPDIFFTILKKGKGKLVRLGDIAEVRFGIKTGANEFFYVEDLTDKLSDSELEKVENLRGFTSVEEIKKAGLRIVKPSKWGKNAKDNKLFLVEEEFLKPVIKSLKEIKSLMIDSSEELKFFMFSPNRKVKNGEFARDYIAWGEKAGYSKKPTCIQRKEWYILPKIESELVFNMSSGSRYLIPFNKREFAIDARLYGIVRKINEDIYKYLVSLNNTFLIIEFEVMGRVMTGSLPLLDLKVYELKDTLVFDVRKFNLPNKDISCQREIFDVFTELGFDPDKPIREQEPNPLPDRKALDDIVFDALGLTEEERKEVYYAVAELVQNRLKKARSV
jgi:hypothetical protein